MNSNSPSNQIDVTHNPIQQTPPKYTKQHQSIEYAALKYSNLEIPTQIYSQDIEIQLDHWIHQVTCGFNNKNHIVLLHGYGGTSLTYVRLFKSLSNQYRVHALDYLGIGLSSRKQFSDEWEIGDIINYYVDSIQKWRQISKIQKFTLAGHSFGGYISSCYAEKYPQRIQRLILISTAGVRFMNKQKSQQQYEKIKERSSFCRRMFLSFAKLMIKWAPTPSKLMNWFLLGNMLLQRILQSRLKLQNEEKQAWKIYMKTIAQIQPTSQSAFFKIFYFPGVGTEYPIQKKLLENKFKFKVQFYYGDNDWMQKQTALKLLDPQTKCPNKISFNIIPNSGHQIIFDNPEKILQYILKKQQH